MKSPWRTMIAVQNPMDWSFWWLDVFRNSTCDFLILKLVVNDFLWHYWFLAVHLLMNFLIFRNHFLLYSLWYTMLLFYKMWKSTVEAWNNICYYKYILPLLLRFKRGFILYLCKISDTMEVDTFDLCWFC